MKKNTSNFCITKVAKNTRFKLYPEFQLNLINMALTTESSVIIGQRQLVVNVYSVLQIRMRIRSTIS